MEYDFSITDPLWGEATYPHWAVEHTIELQVIWEVMKLTWLQCSIIHLSNKIYTWYNCCVTIADGVLLLINIYVLWIFAINIHILLVVVGVFCEFSVSYMFWQSQLTCKIVLHWNTISSIHLYFMSDPVYTYAPVPVNSSWTIWIKSTGTQTTTNHNKTWTVSLILGIYYLAMLVHCSNGWWYSDKKLILHIDVQFLTLI